MKSNRTNDNSLQGKIAREAKVQTNVKDLRKYPCLTLSEWSTCLWLRATRSTAADDAAAASIGIIAAAAVR